MAIPHAQVYVPVTEGLTLSVPVPEVISVQPSKRVCCIKILSAIHVFEPLVRIRSRIVRANWPRFQSLYILSLPILMVFLMYALSLMYASSR